MNSLVLLVALATQGQICDDLERLIRDRVMHGGYGTYAGGCFPTCAPWAAYAGACYGPAMMRAPITSDCRQGSFNQRLDEVKSAVDKLAESLLNLEKKIAEKNAQAKFKALEDKVDAVEKKAKKGVKKLENKLDERIKPLEERTKTTETDLKNLTKKLEDQARAAEIKGLEDKIRALEDVNKTQKFEERLSGNDRIKAIENKLQQIGDNERKRDETIIQFIDQKIDRLQGNLKRDIDGVHDHLKRVDEQLRDEKDARRRIMDRLRQLEKGAGIQPPRDLQLPKGIEKSRDSKEVQDKLPEPSEKEPETKDVRLKTPRLKLAASSQPRLDVPANKALLIVSVPADARVYLNGKLTQSTGAMRTFLTPAIEQGTDFAYTLRVDLVRNGQVVTQSRQVVFRAGRQVMVTFEQQPSLQTAQAR